LAGYILLQYIFLELNKGTEVLIQTALSSHTGY